MMAYACVHSIIAVFVFGVGSAKTFFFLARISYRERKRNARRWSIYIAHIAHTAFGAHSMHGSVCSVQCSMCALRELAQKSVRCCFMPF